MYVCGYTYLKKIKTIAVGIVVSHMKATQSRSNQKSSGISDVPMDQPTLW